MNLIECWSCAKKMSVHDHKSNDGFCAYCGAEIEIDLEYRREHGIFEVGDKVVLIKGKRALLVMFIVEVNTETLCIKNKDGATIIFNKLHIRHATDEEIKAGHRL